MTGIYRGLAGSDLIIPYEAAKWNQGRPVAGVWVVLHRAILREALWTQSKCEWHKADHRFSARKKRRKVAGHTWFLRNDLGSGQIDALIVLALGADRHKFSLMVSLTNAQIRAFKAQAQRLKATLKIGKGGISAQFLAALDDALKHHELVKVKFDDFKDRKKELSPQLAEKSGSRLVARVGNVVVLYRPRAKPEQPTECCFIAQPPRA